MKVKKIVWIIVGIVVAIALVSSGWVYNVIRTHRADELSNLRSTFIQQYGTEATINMLVSPKKVYAVSWTSADGYNNISWNIGGIWLTVYSIPPTADTTP